MLEECLESYSHRESSSLGSSQPGSQWGRSKLQRSVWVLRNMIPSRKQFERNCQSSIFDGGLRLLETMESNPVNPFGLMDSAASSANSVYTSAKGASNDWLCLVGSTSHWPRLHWDCVSQIGPR